MSTTTISWPEAQIICDIPEVRELIDAFAEDSHEDNMLAMVSEIMTHSPASVRAAAPEDQALAQRILEWLGKYGKENSASLLLYEAMKALKKPALSAAPAGGLGEVEEAIRDAIAENMTGLHYCCRTWSAWSVGTMSQNDFWPAGDDSEIIQNITDGVMAAIAAAQGEGK